MTDGSIRFQGGSLIIAVSLVIFGTPAYSLVALEGAYEYRIRMCLPVGTDADDRNDCSYLRTHS